ncbi:glycosyltransferase family 2 protein [Enterococcus devriesei]|uniref:glycosyltransferase family 2 protein n=1 Tax=Enterococcus devriesei TaxID=319970 RepID=UPI00288D5491|nr:glycosyltransferase family 2 protein [Enterococcus devriesei]MDT2821291.1 glycosyltransferase family 2 protein [Enterococcus devriesei]
MIRLGIVLPCYNEDEIIMDTYSKIAQFISELIANEKVSADSLILFVDDGSNDGTWELIKELIQTDKQVRGIKFSRNFGQQRALWAGVTAIAKKVDAVVTLDADLQDDYLVIDEMLEAFQQGSDIVYGVRNCRDTDHYFKRVSAELFYYLMKKINPQMIKNHANFRLMSKRTALLLDEYAESNLYLRGIIPLIGFPSTKVFYSRKERVAGKTKYSIHKMIHLAIDGITSFSIAPIQWTRNIGLLTFLFGVFYAVYILFQKTFNHPVPGWSSLVLSLWLLCGIQLIGISVIGEYVGKIYYEVKRRPKYIIEESTIDLNEETIRENK